MPRRQAQAASAAPGDLHLALVLLPEYLDASYGITTTLLQTANAVAAGKGHPRRVVLRHVAPVPDGLASAAGLRPAVQALDAARQVDALLLPGCHLESAAHLQQWLAQPWRAQWLAFAGSGALQGKQLAASCAGTWALAEAGSLDGREATTTWWLAPEFRQRYPQVLLDQHAIVVDDGPVTTAGAALAHTDLMLHLVARWFGAEVADTCARLLLAERRQVQSRHLSLAWTAQGDPVIRKLHRWIERHLGDTLSVDDLARVVHLTPRTLARRTQQHLGLSPWSMVQRQRLEASVHLLESTTLPFEKIAARVGYADASALRRLLKRELKLAPVALRRGLVPG